MEKIMGLQYTNKNDVSLALAVFLMFDNYEYDERQEMGAEQVLRDDSGGDQGTVGGEPRRGGASGHEDALRHRVLL